MDTRAMLAEMYRVLEAMGIKVETRNLQDSPLPARSGLAKVKGKPVVYIHNRLDPDEKIEVLLSVLRELDFSDIYISPALRELLEMQEQAE